MYEFQYSYWVDCRVALSACCLLIIERYLAASDLSRHNVMNTALLPAANDAAKSDVNI